MMIRIDRNPTEEYLKSVGNFYVNFPSMLPSCPRRQSLEPLEGFLFMSEWIKSHANIWDHHKVIKLCELVQKPDYAVVGHLHSLWHFTLKNRWRDANLEAWGDAGIERASRWDGSKGLWVASMRECGLLDGFIVHDWIQEAGKLVEDRLYKESRRRVEKSRRQTPARVEESSVEKSSEDKSTTAVVEVPQVLKPLQLFSNDSALVAKWQTLAQGWTTAYPGIDIFMELRAAHNWLLENPDKPRKSKVKFLGNWFRNAHGRLSGKTYVKN